MDRKGELKHDETPHLKPAAGGQAGQPRAKRAPTVVKKGLHRRAPLLDREANKYNDDIPDPDSDSLIPE